MADEQDGGQDRTEEPTDKRRKDFRNDGKVAQSRDLASVGVLLAVSGTLGAWFPSMAEAAQELTREIFVHATLNPQSYLDEPLGIFHKSIVVMARMSMPVLMAGVAAALLVVPAQVGLHWSWKPLEPKPERLNPIQGLQQKMFSAQAIAEWVKAMAKVVLVATVSWIVMKAHVEYVGELALVSLTESFSRTAYVVGILVIGLLLTMLVLSLGDFAFQKWNLMRKMRMTLEEMKRENKESEGDPHMKAKLRRMMVQMSSNRLVAEVTDATAIIVNPTHYAVAVRYELGQGGPPLVVARGLDERARLIKDIARSAGVPRIENRPLARALYAQTKEGSEIPVDLYEAVAEVLAFVYRLRKSRAPAASGAPPPLTAH
jgi:flagellar biosynthesis protein FlhB